MQVNLARTLARSVANGPGERFVVWTQGCPLACPGCWNQDTWRFDKRDVRDTDDLIQEILATRGIEGVTFTGGEPFAQARQLAEVARAVRREGLSVFVFTGYDLSELTRAPHLAMLAATDVLVAGRYVEALRTHELAWRGSSNQQVHFLTERYSAAAMDDAPCAELHIDPDGTITITGFPADALLTPAP